MTSISNQTVLMFIHYDEMLINIESAIERLKSDGYHFVVLYERRDKPGLSYKRIEKACQRMELEAVGIDDAVETLGWKAVPFWQRAVVQILKWTPLRRGVFSFYLQFMRRSIARHFFEKYKPVLILSGRDRTVSWDATLIALAKERGIPSMSYQVHNSAVGDLFARDRLGWMGERTVYPLEWLMLPLIRRVVPENSYTLDDGNDVYFAHPLTAFAAKLFGAFPHIPWVIGGSRTDSSLLISEKYLNECRKFGVEDKRLIVAGVPIYDTIADLVSEREDIYKNLVSELEVPENTRFITLAPARMVDYWHQRTDAASKTIATTFGALVEELCSLIETILPVDPAVHILLKLHPRDLNLPEEAFKFTEDFGERLHVIRDIPLQNLTVVSHLLVTKSRTPVQWALAAEVPVISYNLLPKDEASTADYLWRGVIDFAETQEQFGGIVHKYLLGERKSPNNEALSAASLFDGKCTRRFVDEVKYLAG